MTDGGGRSWQAVDVSGDPHLLLGRRQGRAISAVRLDVHSGLHSEMRRVGREALLKIRTTTGKSYDSFAALEHDEEHFKLTVSDVKRLSGELDDHGSLGVGVSRPEIGISEAVPDRDPALIECLRTPMRHPIVERADFASFNPFFYAICFQQQDGAWVSFVRKTNPQQFFKLGRVWCQYADTLKRVDQQPTFALESGIDVVYRSDDLVAFSDTALKFLFTDMRLARSAVPQQVTAIQEQMKSDLPLSDAGASALRAAGARKSSIASRIYGLSARLEELRESAPLTADRFRQIAGDDEAAGGLINDSGQLEFTETRAEVFLDFIEGRYFEDDWTGVPRRADRFSKRR